MGPKDPAVDCPTPTPSPLKKLAERDADNEIVSVGIIYGLAALVDNLHCISPPFS
jgi:hypothetical protein